MVYDFVPSASSTGTMFKKPLITNQTSREATLLKGLAVSKSFSGSSDTNCGSKLWSTTTFEIDFRAV